MRRLRLVSQLVVLTLGVSVVTLACGGGGDENTDPTATSVATASPTTVPPTAAETGSPVETASTGGTGGIGGAPASSTSVASPPAEATATERPRTVMTTPKPIASRAPQATIGISFPTATPPTSDGGDLATLFEHNFDDGDAGSLFVGTADSGATASVVDGRYVASSPAGFWQTFSIEETAQLQNGVFWAQVGVAGNGAGGIFARYRTSDDGASWGMVLCWISSEGAIGCHSIVNNEWTALFVLDAGAIALQEMNALIVSLADDGLYFEVNGVEAGSATLPDVGAGWWGVYMETYADSQATISFDDISVWDAGP